MGIIYVMLVVSLLIALFFLASFIWAAKTDQFEDDYSPSVRILFDDEIKPITTNSEEDANREV